MFIFDLRQTINVYRNDLLGYACIWLLTHLLMWSSIIFFSKLHFSDSLHFPQLFIEDVNECLSYLMTMISDELSPTCSIVSVSFLQVRRFCKEKNHNKAAPTKHNALCRSRSAWEVIEQTPDFVGGR